MYRLNGMASRHGMTANCRKLLELEEETLFGWILDMYQRGLPSNINCPLPCPITPIQFTVEGCHYSRVRHSLIGMATNV